MAFGAIDETQVSLTLDAAGPVMLVSGDLVGRPSTEIAGLRANFAATADPTSAASFAMGYARGSRWHNTATNTIFECVADSTWAQIYPADGSGSFQPLNSTLTDIAAAGLVPVVEGGTGRSSAGTLGSLLVSTGSTSAMGLVSPGGTVGNVLTERGSGLPPAFQIPMTSVYCCQTSVLGVTSSVVQWTTSAAITGFNASPGTDRITVTNPGIYLVGFNIEQGSLAAAGNLNIQIDLNGTLVGGTVAREVNDSASARYSQVSGSSILAITGSSSQYVRLRSTGSNPNAGRFFVVRLSV